MTRPPDQVDLVLFDLGGVLVRFGGVTGLGALTGSTDDAIWARWLSCPWVRRFETGGCSAEEFATGLVASWGLPLDPADFLDQFRRWPSGPLEGAEDLVAGVAQRASVGCLSNTNRVHWEDHLAKWPLTGRFDPRFLSFEMGVLKPDRAAFDHVAARIDPPPPRVLFLDDNRVNVEEARACGFRAAHVEGVAGARRALESVGVL